MLVKKMFKQFLFKAKIYHLNSILNRFYILPLHMITDKPNGFYPEISVRLFEKQIAYLVKNYNIISMDEIVEKVQKRKSLRRLVAITFDDGFKDNYEKAYPILKKYSVPATIFLTTGYIESRTIPWFIKLRYMFMKTNKTKLNLTINKKIIIPMKTKEEKFTASEKVMVYLKDCPNDQKIYLLDRIGMELAVNEFKELSDLMLTWNEIKEMSENGISFGAHTVNHPVLTKIPQHTIKEEILQSKQTIEEKIGKPVTGFAYPFGNEGQYNSYIFKILQKLQFKFALTSTMGTNSYHSEIFALNRAGPWELSLLK